MSGHHDEHHLQEQKPIAFTVPFILAAALVLIIMLFLSLCDPKPHHGGHDAAHEGHGAATEAVHHHDAAPAATVAAEPAHAAEAHH